MMHAIKKERENSHSIFCFISSVGARSMVVLEWQLGIVGSAPWHSNRVHTSILDSRETHNKCQWHTCNSGLVLYPTLPGLGCSFMKRSELPQIQSIHIGSTLRTNGEIT